MAKKRLNVCSGQPVVLFDKDGGTTGGDWFITIWQDISPNDSDKVFGPVPANMEYQILWVQVLLTTSADVGNRQLEVRVEHPSSAMPGSEGAWAIAGQTQAASLTRQYIFAPGLADQLAFRDTDWLSTPIPVTSLLYEGDQVRVLDNNAVAAGADEMYVYIQYAYRAI